MADYHECPDCHGARKCWDCDSTGVVDDWGVPPTIPGWSDEVDAIADRFEMNLDGAA